jgi:signal transduction histidine kinase
MTEKRSKSELESILSMLDKNVLRAKTLHDIARNITFSTNLNTIYKTALDSSVGAIGASNGAFLTYDSEEEGFHVKYECGKKLKKDFFPYKGAFPEGLESISLDSSLVYHMLHKGSDLKKLMSSIRSSVIIPISILDKFYGILEVGKKVDDTPYTSQDVEFLVTLCSLISISIENAESQKELNYKIFEISTLYEISTELSSSLNITQIQTAIIFCCMGVIGAKRGAIFLYDAADSTLSLNHTINFPPSVKRDLSFKIRTDLVEELSEKSYPFSLSDLRKNSKTYNLFAKVKNALKVIENPLIIPQILNKKLVGYLILAEKINKSVYSRADIDLLFALSYQSSLAITNAQSFLNLENLAKKNAALYAELKVATEEKLKAERLATLGMVISTIVHDIKNPLTSIRYFSALLGTTDADARDKKLYVDIIESETERLSGMIEDILSFAKGDQSSLKIRECNIKNLFDEVSLVLKMDFKKKKIAVVNDLKYTGNAMLDDEKIKRVLYNISYNARDALKENGGKITFKTSTSKGFLNISIADNGNGIPEKVIDTLFMPFVSHGKRRGTGLGLSISKKIVDDHGGELTFTTKKNKGTTFNIKLPLYIQQKK